MLMAQHDWIFQYDNDQKHTAEKTVVKGEENKGSRVAKSVA